ncbi:uncharacterized protein [Leptinotarsa decemlineata]|uniref:uncharacterized protein n=1 Tax=Leptinotarsa decemlineata TaxID=7539 RepID=UPI003D305503
MDIQNENWVENQTNQQDTSLQSAISSLAVENDTKHVLGNVKVCLEYLSTFSISEVDTTLLKQVLLAIQKGLQKIYDDNSLLSDTSNDDFVVNILKDNLHMASDFLQLMRVIFEFVLENNEVRLSSVKNTTFTSAQVILSTFDHCKSSSEDYKDTFREDLLEIFQKAQELHLLFLKMLETCAAIDLSENSDEILILKQVLETICALSIVLSDLNMKSLITNWKGYIAIAQKFSHVLIDYIDIKLPINCLTSEIARTLSSLHEMESDDPRVVQVIRKTGFLVKVVLKICDIFWDCMEKVCETVLDFNCIVYSKPPEYFESLGFSGDIISLIENSIFTSLVPFVSRLVVNDAFLQVLSNQNFPADKFSPGLLNFLNEFLKCVIKKENVDCLDHVIRLIFTSIKECFEEFSSPLSSARSIFHNLVIHTAASVINHDGFYAGTEQILLENILQEDVWCAMLATDVWCLLLGKSTETFRLETFFNLVKIYKELDFGTNTHRLEKIYLRNFIRRVFGFLPENSKNEAIEITRRNGISLWKITGFENFPAQKRQLVEDVCTLTVEKIGRMDKDGFGIEEFRSIVENLESLSSASVQDMGPNSKNMVDAIGMFWESSYVRLSNNVFNYFIRALCKMTRTLISEFDNRQLFTILNQLKMFSAEDALKLYVCEILSSLSEKNTNEFGQDQFKIFSLMSCVLYPNLITSSNSIIKQSALELVEKLVANDKEDVVRETMNASSEVKIEIVNYLQKEIASKAVDRDYFRSLGELEYTHQCVKWQSGNIVQVSKRFKLDEVPKELKGKSAKVLKPKVRAAEGKQRCQLRETAVDGAVEDKTDVNEAIASIKSEVKCLMKVLKTEKLTQKNVSDLKMISNQLLSLL